MLIVHLKFYKVDSLIFVQVKICSVNCILYWTHFYNMLLQ